MLKTPPLSLKKMSFNIFAACLLLGGLTLSPNVLNLFVVKASAQTVSSSMVPIQKIDFDGGSLVQVDKNRGIWTEYDFRGTPRYNFETLTYSAPRLRLRGLSGNVQLLVNTQTKTISGEWPGHPMAKLYDVKSVQFDTVGKVVPSLPSGPSVETGVETIRPVYTPPGKERPQSAIRLTAQNLGMAEYDGGKFFRVAGEQWLENAKDGRLNRYNKIGSDKDSVFLYDASRKYLVALNVRDRMARVSEDGQMMRGLYPLTNLARSNRGGGVPGGNATPIPDQEGKMSAIERTQCLTKGGFIERAGLLGYERCTMRYNDGGNICIDSSNCQGKCLATPQDAQTNAVSGLCQKTDSPFGCYAEVVAGKVGPAICVD